MPSFDLDHASEPDSGASPQAPDAHGASPLSHAGNQAVQRRLLDAGLGPGAPTAGEPLSIRERNYFEPRFGPSLAGVRIHTGPAAERSAAELNAHAYTLGADIVFGRGEYQPDSPEGRRLIAHELTHVVQQSKSGNPQVQRKPIDGTCSADDQVCEPIPENPLAGYPYLVVALDRDSLQMLQDAAYRREYLRRGLPYDGPPGLSFAQGHLTDFLAPGTEYVSREELLSALMPGLLDSARTHSDPGPFITEIARNEAARQMLEPLRNPVVNVELQDPDGLEDTPVELKFNADFKELPDDHGALALASLDPLSSRGAYLWTLIAIDDARQLAAIAELNAKTEWLLEKYGERLNDMIADAAGYTQDEVYALSHDVMPELVSSANNLSSVLTPGNKDQAELVTKISGSVQTLSTRASKAMDAMNDFRKNNMPDRTAGEIYEDNAQDIRDAAAKDWDEGGLSYFAWFGNKIGLGSNKIVHGVGNLSTGGYMDTHAARAHAYRLGHISYENYTGFHISDIVKGAIGDLAVALPFFGKGIGAAASTLLGLEEGTAAAGYVGGTAGGFSTGFLGAAGNDAASFIASKASASDADRSFQAAQIGGPLSWIESGAWGGVMGGPAGALSSLIPRPGGAPSGAAPESGPGVSGEVQSSESPAAPTTEEETAQTSFGETSPAEPYRLPDRTGMMGYLRRSLLNKLLSSSLEGAEPFNVMPKNSGPTGNVLLSVVEDRGPLVSTSPGDLATGPIDFNTAPDLPAAGAATVEANATNPVQLDIEVTEAADSPATQVPANQVPAAQPGLPDFGGVNPAPGARTTTQAQWNAADRERRIERRIDAIFSQLERGAGQAAPQGEVEAPMAIDIQIAIRQALANIRASGRRPAGNAAFGTVLHAELARVLRAQGFPAGAIPHVELTFGAFNTLPQAVLQRTVQQWFQNEGQAYQWLRDSLPASVLNSLVADIKPDFEISIGGNNIAFDLTSRERESHLAKTMLYAAILAREGQMTRVQEYYWVRWNWRGQ